MSKKRAVPDKVVFYCDNSGEHRWKRVASNGKIIGASTEGYKNKGYCKTNFYRQLNTDYIVVEDME